MKKIEINVKYIKIEIKRIRNIKIIIKNKW